jgi:hypothetical protein
MPAIGWTTFRLPQDELEQVKLLSKKFELSFARMMLEIVRIGVKHVSEIGLNTKEVTKKKSSKK